MKTWRLTFPIVGLLIVGLWTGCAPNKPLSEPRHVARLSKIRVAKHAPRFETSRGSEFIPIGVNYYRPGTGWAPQLWRKFDPEATRSDFKRLKEYGVNCVRVFLTYGSFYRREGELDAEGLAKFDEFLKIAEEAGIYVHPTGPDHWEGMPDWRPVAIEQEQTVKALESFWKLFASRYRGRNIIFAYDLKNEPELAWTSPTLRSKWNEWLKSKYVSASALSTAWHDTNSLSFGSIESPSDRDSLKSRMLLDYQTFREEVADEWTRRQAQAIKSADPDALVTVGLIQWSVPALLPGLRHYSAFRPERQARYLDFLEVHFYPLARGALEYRNESEVQANLAYLESVVREVARPGKPVVLAEFGWYGGGKPKFDGGKHPEASEEQHEEYCRRAVETSAPFVRGWLNWGFYDQPEATDCSEMTGLLKADGTEKAWGRAFKTLAKRASQRKLRPAKVTSRPNLDWDSALTSMAAAASFRDEYLKACLAQPSWAGASGAK